jgi:AcrR family transcriptional regulator
MGSRCGTSPAWPNSSWGLASYHFGSKEELFRQVVERRADALAAIELEALEAVAPPSATTPARVDDILRAYVVVRFDLLFERGEEWARYCRLSHHFLALEDRGRFIGRYRQAASAVFVRHVDSLCAALPQLHREQVETAFDFLRLTLASVSGDTTSVALSHSIDHGRDAAIDTLVRLYSAGLTSLAPDPPRD